jgi:isochorismate synthase
MRGFVKYRLPHSSEVIEMQGEWLKRDHLKGFNNSGFVFSEYSNSPYLVFSENKKEVKVDLSLCYRKKDHELCANYGEYIEKVSEIIDRIRTEEFDKVIFSRRHKINNYIDPLTVFETLNKHYDNSFNYVLGIEGEGVWLGASPEVLIQSKDDRFDMHSLAGTMAKNENGNYKWTQKEIREQAYVTDYLIDKFDEANITNIIKNGPFNFEHGKVAHLKTNISIKATDTQINDMLRIVPPSPAVCGIPKEKILNEIQSIEGYNRRFYTGTIGLYEKNNVHLFVNLRCMEFFLDSAMLYLGGGITNQSDPDAEWEETEMKARTLLDLL